MQKSDSEAVAALVGHAMNAAEGQQARETLRFHFGCRTHGLDDGRNYYVLEENGTVIGVVGLHFYHWGPAENVWLAWFAVDPKLRGTGLGKAMLDFITERALDRGYSKLLIETYSTPEFATAHRFYQAAGFAQTGAIDAYLANGGDMVVFSKELTHHV